MIGELSKVGIMVTNSSSEKNRSSPERMEEIRSVGEVFRRGRIERVKSD